MVPFLTKQTQRTHVMFATDWSFIGMKQFLYATHQHSERGIDIHCKVTFGFKYRTGKNQSIARRISSIY